MIDGAGGIEGFVGWIGSLGVVVKWRCWRAHGILGERRCNGIFG